MKKIFESHHFDASSVKMFRGDIEEIIAIIRESCDKTQISDGEYEFDSLDELVETSGSTVKYLEINGGLPNIYVKLGRQGGQVCGVKCSVYGIGTEALFLKIRERLRRGERFGAKIFNKTASSVVAVFLFPVSFASAYFSLMDIWTRSILPYAIMFVILSCFIFALSYLFDPPPRFLRFKQPPWNPWERTSCQLQSLRA